VPTLVLIKSLADILLFNKCTVKVKTTHMYKAKKLKQSLYNTLYLHKIMPVMYQ